MPRTRRSLLPAEVIALADGDQEQWNRTALLAAWVAWFVASCMPRSYGAKKHPMQNFERFQDFMKVFNPPGYVREKDKR